MEVKYFTAAVNYEMLPLLHAHRVVEKPMGTSKFLYCALFLLIVLFKYVRLYSQVVKSVLYSVDIVTISTFFKNYI